MKIKLVEPKYYLLKCEMINLDLSYELFLLEVLNNSKFFLNKSTGQKYSLPSSESHGENDAITDNYELDFKLLVDQEMMKLKGQNKPDIDYSLLNKGIIIKRDKEIINNKSENILFKLLKFDFKGNNKDIKNLLANLKKNKNLFIYFPYEFKTSELMNENQVKRLLEITLNNILKYRSNCQPNNDTYLCVNFNKKFIIFEWNDNKLYLVDRIEELKLLSLY